VPVIGPPSLFGKRLETKSRARGVLTFKSFAITVYVAPARRRSNAIRALIDAIPNSSDQFFALRTYPNEAREATLDGSLMLAGLRDS
jgi:ribosomal protein S7